MIRQHHSQCEKVVITSDDENMTEQAHAADLEIKNMIRGGGFHFSEKQPIYGDFTDLPDLNRLMMNRQRINQVHSQLDPRIKKHLRTPDEMIRMLTEGSEQDMIEVGLLQPAKPEPTPDPAPPVDNPPTE